MKKNRPKYTTIQIRTEIMDEIRTWCNQRNVIISGYTEAAWQGIISASLSISGSSGK